MNDCDPTPAQPDGQPSLRTVPEGRYVDFSVAGEGGMGIVYQARDTELNRPVAFKIVRPCRVAKGTPSPHTPIEASPPEPGTDEMRSFERLRSRFLQEAWVTGTMEHPGIVPVYELGETKNGIPYYTMRFVKGGRSLATEIEDRRGAPLDARLKLLEPFLKACDAVRYGHSRGVVHRDLKPENIAIGQYGDVVLLDWGLAKVEGTEDVAEEQWRKRIEDFREAVDLRTSLSALGTPGYMSPEAALGRLDEIDARSDVYSLGAILFEILTGQLPFTFRLYTEYLRKITREDTPPARSLDPTIPVQLSDLCVRALSREKERRPSSAGEITTAIRRWQAESVIEREVARLTGEARAMMETARGLKAKRMIPQVDRANNLIEQALQRRPDDGDALVLRREVASLRELGIQRRVAKWRRMVIAGVLALILVTLTAAGIMAVLNHRRREAVQARRETHRLLLTSYLEQGRQEILAGHPDRALVYLSKAYEEGANSPSLPFLLELAIGGLELRSIPLTGHTGTVSSAVFSADSRRILTTAADHSARIWDAATGATTKLSGHHDEVVGGAFSPDGAKVVTASKDRTARVWDAVSGESLLELEGHTDRVLSAVFSPDGRHIVTASTDGTARIWDAGTGRSLQVLEGHGRWVLSAVWSPDGSRLVTAGADGTARIWDAATARELQVLSGHERELRSASFSPRGDRVVTAGWDGTARIWDSRTGEIVAVLEGHGGPVTSAEFGPEGRRVVTASTDRTARIWEVANKTAPAILEGHADWVIRASFSPDGRRVLTGGKDGTSRIWEAETGKGLAVLEGHTARIKDATFSPDGNLIVTASADRTARVWNLSLQKRSSAEVAAYVQKTVPLRLEKGRLVKVER